MKEIKEKARVIQQRLKVASDRQKSYADLKRKDIEYKVRDKVFLKVSPWRKILRFGKKGKSSPRFIGPYEILERIGPVAYRLVLPPELAKLHNVFHVSDFSFDEEPKVILACEVKQLRNKQVPLVKVLGQHHDMEEEKWESESTMRAQYPQLFNSGMNFEDEILLTKGGGRRIVTPQIILY